MLEVKEKISKLVENKKMLRSYKEAVIKSNPFNYFKFYQQLYTNSEDTINLVLNNESLDISDIHYHKTKESEYFSHMTNIPPNSQINIQIIEEYIEGLYDDSPIKVVKQNDNKLYYLVASDEVITTLSKEYIIPKILCINEDLYQVHNYINMQRKRTISQ